MGGEQGIALIAALWALALLAALLVGFAGVTRTETVLARNLLDHARARHLAEGAIQLTALRLLEPGGTRALRIDGAPFEVIVDGNAILVSVQDEGGKIDLNSAPEELLESLFRSVGAPEREARALAGRVAEWREEAVELGAASRDYAALGQFGAPRGRLFAHIGELAYVLGMRAEWFERLRPLVTILNGQDGVDPASAPGAVLAALPGFDPSSANALVARRSPAYFRRETADLDLGSAEIFARPSRGVGFAIRAEVPVAADRAYRREALVLLTGGLRQPFRIVDLR